MRVIDASGRITWSHHCRLWRLVAVAVIGTLTATCLWASSAAASVIHVNTTKETAIFRPVGPNGLPVYHSKIVGDRGTADKCSLREAIQAANTHKRVRGCLPGSGDDTIMLTPGVYHILDNFFIEEPMTFLGPNKGLAGNDPKRGKEAVLSFDYNPDWAAQIAMFWLDQPQDTGDAKGAGTVFDGVDMQGGFTPDCNIATPCDNAAIVQPSKIDQPGFTLTHSIIGGFGFGVYLGGRDKITRDVFEGNDRDVNVAPAAGWDIYSDFVYTAPDTIIDDNVFKNPDLGGVILQGDTSRGTVFGGQVEHNLFLKEVNHDLGLYLIQTSGVVVKDNLFESPPNLAPLPKRLDSAIRIDRVDHAEITGNTITGWGNGIKIGGLGSGTPGVTDTTIAFNRFYDNLYGVQVTAQFATAPDNYRPLAVDANDDWWGANGGPGSTGARPGAINPVNGVQFFDSNGNPVANPGGITVDRWLHLTCTVPPTVQVDVPAHVVGQVVGMPTVDVTSSTPPWFFADSEPIMAASAPGIGNVFGFDQVPDEGPNNAQLTGTLLATNTGKGKFLDDLDSEQVACPLTATSGPIPDIGKDPDNPTVTAGGLAGYRITVTNRGSIAARNWWVCDRIPRQTAFVRATRTLRRLGRLRCLVIPTLGRHQRVSFHLTLRIARNASSSTLTNAGEVIPGPSGGGTPPVRVPIRVASAKQKVRHPASAPAAPPSFTG